MDERNLVKQLNSVEKVTLTWKVIDSNSSTIIIQCAERMIITQNKIINKREIYGEEYGGLD